MNIYVLTIHNPKYSLGPHARLKSFIDSTEGLDINFILPKFTNKKSKKDTLGILIQSFFRILINRRKIDLLHVVTPPSYVGLIAVFAKKILRLPYIVDIGDPYAENMAVERNIPHTSLHFKLLKRLDNLVYRNSSHLILTSPLLTNYIPKYIHNTTIITGIARENDIKEVQLTNNKKFIYIGNYGPLQNLDYIIEVFKKAAKKDNKIRLDIVGNGALNEETKNKLQVEDKIKFLDPIPQEKIPDLLKNYSCGIVSLNLDKSLDYAIPTKLLTYLTQGLPVFGTGGKAAEKLLRSTKAGYISTNYDKDRDAKEMIKIISSPKMAQILSHNAIQYSKRHLSLENFGKKVALIYKSYRN
ncbi:glycosyltransferase family 4 protein [Candidatus Peregrinibacteria bacterium]|jgi:glycosyltransferase involved in cell wall biosynthesis|nr:glycosyltransferase family 4 protein [Candidatus Peregrinibacteria bacterium]MBT4056229.1 glycosyltransferase family 4 protein [Candidatus Peregrinibacteria bacterium]